ncbi:type II toxin-antitoxin system antitoxin, RelB/DinJ family [Campylobacter sp. MIT 99-7217]|uniref:type II toxin-antitoxin system RelB/DinJ family antitoxin n=1 Tax=Campylobacter sp. MIT 99-7217 TaxID=535091 RepID=UPI0011574857|nr:type II toxin-antitoxin system RelB/DinJ family antitoxin [Campylobacter sp. MIT 99-7217]TQR33107.1 type II toxin-antitoxin system antitoxin, RelB/DinJ family [Campylobacter sp. MIT 99-7217]
MQNKTINVTFRMDKEDKKHFERIINSMGLNLSSAFNIFAKAVIRDSAIPFELKGQNIPNEETIRAIENVEKDENLEEVTIEQLIAEYEAQKLKSS